MWNTSCYQILEEETLNDLAKKVCFVNLTTSLKINGAEG
jgi:hypothetical protein